MSENNSNHSYLKLREAINETLLRDLILFLMLYVFILTQDWENLFLFTFPITSFAFSIFFRILSINKKRLHFSEYNLTYNPFGSEKLYANRLCFVSLFQLILLFWIGAESIYHPQMIKIYNIYFCSLFSGIYSFGFYWLFVDLWKNSKIAVSIPAKNSIREREYELILSNLKFKNFRNISILNLILFLLLNSNIILFQILVEINPLFGFNVYLPGTGIEDSNPLNFSFVILAVLILFPLMCIFSLYSVHNAVSSLNKEELTNFMNAIPEENRALIKENLKKLNRMARELFEIE